MSRIRLLLVFILLIAASLLTFAAATETFTGVVTDDMCGPDHMMLGKSAAECTRACVKDGSKYALVVDKKVYILEGHAAELDKLAGAKATVTGEVKGTTVQVTSVAAAK
jgi:hypothetical protein